MNMKLSLHQRQVVWEISRGLVYYWSEEWRCWARRGDLTYTADHEMLMSKSRARCGNHEGNSVVELVQRGAIVEEIRDGLRVLVLCKDLRKRYKPVPPPPPKKRVFPMSRTRAARVVEGVNETKG